MELPIITKKTIKEHIKAIEKTKKQKTFKPMSNKILKELTESNPELVKIIIPTLESKKSDEYKAGYLAGITTLFDILRRQANKSQ